MTNKPTDPVAGQGSGERFIAAFTAPVPDAALLQRLAEER